MRTSYLQEKLKTINKEIEEHNLAMEKQKNNLFRAGEKVQHLTRQPNQGDCN